MYRLLEFIRSVYVMVLFVVFEAIAVGYYARSSYFTQARILTQSNRIAGGVHGAISGVGRYFSLGSENELLLDRVASLETELQQYRQRSADTLGSACSLDSVLRQYVFSSARVNSNSVNKLQNYIILDKGTASGVSKDMAVLSPDGAMVGYIVECSPGYSVAISILNTAFRASGRLAGSEYFGSISWDGTDRYHVSMSELSKYAELHEGDEIISTGFSQYFPAGVVIGYVESFSLTETQTAYNVILRLAADISGLSHVVIVKNNDADEIRQIEKTAEQQFEKK